jgi:GNAT superfamily N-acetyltransferase
VLFEEAGQPAGYALYRRDPEYVYLRQFYVCPDRRRQGIGRAAIAWLRQHAWDGRRVRVEVLVSRTATSDRPFWLLRPARCHEGILDVRDWPQS